jgi:hypothetical protein
MELDQTERLISSLEQLAVSIAHLEYFLVKHLELVSVKVKDAG